MFKKIFRDNFNKFSATQRGGGVLDSNSMIAKFAFLVLVVILFVVFLALGTSFLTWFFSPSGTPTLIDGLVDGNQQLIIEQNPNVKGSIPIIRSDNKRGGVEFTWSVWLYVTDAPTATDSKQFSHVFHKGEPNNADINSNGGISFPNNAPGLYIDNTKMKDRDNGQLGLKIIMNTFNSIDHDVIHVNDVPYRKWFNVIIRTRDQNLDVYVNGTIVNRHVLQGVPKQNYGKVYVAMNGGFNGNISDLKYFNYSLGTTAIQSLVMKGPNLKVPGGSSKKVAPPYLGLRWYLFN